jgi:hypothetical protein
VSGERRAASFDIHGLTATIACDWPVILEALRRDFAWFELAEITAIPAIEIEVEHGRPDYDTFASATATLITERNVVFRSDGRTIIDYLGRAVAVIEPGGRRLTVIGADGWVVRRAAFDFLLARAGARLDEIGLPRVHGLGLVGREGGVLVMLPMGGGKTTLALRALAAGIPILSESSPLLDRQGRLHALPLPLWVRNNSPEVAALPAEHLRALDGIDSDPAIVEISAFSDLVPRAPVRLRHLVLGTRSLDRTPTLDRLPRRAAVVPILRDSVAGLGFFQGVEFLLRNSASGVASQVATAARRAAHCRTAIARASVWRLALGRDREANWDALARLLD